MRIDRELQEKVLAALEWEPGVNAAGIGVSVNDCIVTLQGTVSTLREKWLAERATRRVDLVRAVANDIDVEPGNRKTRTDASIAAAAATAVEWDSAVPADAVKVTVRNGWITLTGSVGWHYQKTAAERAVQRLTGVKGVANSIVVKPSADTADVKAEIERTLTRGAQIDAGHITVDTHGGTVILTGRVRSLHEKDEAERAAWATPGVTRVDDRLEIAG
jgi:osmotically-inducible protein OsmY